MDDNHNYHDWNIYDNDNQHDDNRHDRELSREFTLLLTPPSFFIELTVALVIVILVIVYFSESKGFKKLAKPVPKPKAIPPPNTNDVVDSIDVKAKQTIPYQITRVKDLKRVVIKTGKFKKGQLWITNAVKQRSYYADLKQLSWVERKTLFGKKLVQILIFDIFYSEPLRAKGDEPEWSQEVEDMIVDSKVDQEVEVAQGPLPFKITRTIAIAMVVSAIFSMFFGLSMNSMFHFVPNTVIHWIPTG